MYLFLSDETNTTQSDTVQFLIFGAMVIPMENAPAAVKEVLEIRQCYGYPSGSEFKFDTRSKQRVEGKVR
jgi:tetrahydromethanopterin S-methyltransferase subunit H